MEGGPCVDLRFPVRRVCRPTSTCFRTRSKPCSLGTRLLVTLMFIRPKNSLQRCLRRLSSSMATPPAKWKTLAPPPPPGSLIASAQATLGRLPVPELSKTFARLRRTLKPLARSESELFAAEKKIAEYENGLAKTLQQRLLKRQEETEHWLEEWWDSGAYMGYRDSVSCKTLWCSEVLTYLRRRWSYTCPTSVRVTSETMRSRLVAVKCR